MKQATMFEQFDSSEKVAETFTDHRLPADAKPRLGGQNATVLARLRDGAATNIELQQLGAGRVNSRIADLRKYLKSEGLTIESKAVDTAKGIYEYQIVRREVPF